MDRWRLSTVAYSAREVEGYRKTYRNLRFDRLVARQLRGPPRHRRQARAFFGSLETSGAQAPHRRPPSRANRDLAKGLALPAGAPGATCPSAWWSGGRCSASRDPEAPAWIAALARANARFPPEAGTPPILFGWHRLDP
ncbi:MAG: hypothetical protein OXC72_10755 [Roseovarius sp.]|nr:hypothetical protein [Roseovarius sp.]